MYISKNIKIINMSEKNTNVVVTYREPSVDILIQPDSKNKKDNEDLILDVKQKNLSTYYTSNIFGKIFFNWTRYAMKLANNDHLKISDFKGIGEEDHSENLFKPILDKWNKEKSKVKDENYKKNLFFKSILKVYYKKIILLSFLNLITSGLKYLQIYFYDAIIQNFEHYHEPEETKSPLFPIYGNAIGLILTKVFTTFFHHQVKFHSEIAGVKAANGVAALIYEKVMNSSVFLKNQISEGEILNFIQVDAEKLNYLFTSLPAIAIIPFNLTISFYYLFSFFGLTFFVGIGMLIIIVLIIWIVQYRYLVNTEIMLEKKDKRMRLTTHILHIIKILKLFGWEEEFKENIDKKRNDELINIRNIFYLIAVRTFVNSNLSILTSLATIGGYTYFHGPMEVDTLFSSTKLIQEVAEPMVNIPQYIADLQSLKISLNRIQDFLTVKNIEKKLIQKEDNDELQINSNYNKIEIEFKNCDFGIKGEKGKENTILLKGINLMINKEELITIIGETGSGKSCLINALLGNLELLNPEKSEINFNTKSDINISYASQDPWIMNGTIRENIIFYNTFDKERYNKVINVCQLNEDLNNLEHGDMTEVGSTGNNLSGGQRARISLARAIYKDADIYIFDDPISSVDTYVSMKIFHQGIVNFLKNKTKIFVTHDTRNLKYSQKIILMNNFNIEFNGSYDEYIKNEKYKQINENKNKDLLNKDITDIDRECFKAKDETFGKLLKEEDQVSGKVTCRIYNKFFKINGGYLLFIFIIILAIAVAIASTIAKLFVTNWTDRAEKEDDDKINKEDNYKFFIKYSSILFAGIVIQMIKEFLVAYSNYKGTKYLHENMIYNIIHAPINLFHDIIPIGQILNRLIHDLELTQEIIWKFNTILISIIGILISIYVCFMENKETIYAAPVIIILAIILLFYFISSGRDLNRLDGTSRSPIISLFSETILGITTIRTFKQEKTSKEKFYKKLDDHFGVMLYRYGTDNWFCMTLDIISHIYLTYVLLRTILDINHFDAAAIGIMLDYSIEISEELLEAFEQATQVEKSLVSLERCDAYMQLPCEKYENEKLKETLYELSDKTWPSEGRIKFENFSIKYRNDCNLALKNINIEINPGEKIGIVGRTGSGKSSLTLSLFRIIEAFNGKIEIDGYDIHNIPLKKLRRSISIVPQEPFLLEGTLKTNLDPLNLYTESEINEVLKNVKLYEMLEHDIANKNIKLNGINTEIKEYGNNLSFGCRQLLCVARAILRKSKIIILDEATSSVDQKTEDIIINAVDTMFKDSTVITIAHRINTVKSCDKVIIMNEGEIVEVGNPNELIKNTNSKFNSLYYQYIEAIK